MPARSGATPDPLYDAKADLFRVLGHPARVRIVQVLREGERSVGSLQDALGLDSGGTSQHLAALRGQGLVATRRQGTSVFYRVADDTLLGLMDAARAVVASGIDRQKAQLDELAGSLDAAEPSA
ncbi:MAG: metalloregulator ArsR/SmtB family transcription factor [Thermoleophilia bacterium]